VEEFFYHLFYCYYDRALKRKIVIAGSKVVLSQTLAVSHGDDNIIGHRAKVIVQMYAQRECFPEGDGGGIGEEGQRISMLLVWFQLLCYKHRIFLVALRHTHG